VIAATVINAAPFRGRGARVFRAADFFDTLAPGGGRMNPRTIAAALKGLPGVRVRKLGSKREAARA
jgi:hypothetical protein